MTNCYIFPATVPLKAQRSNYATKVAISPCITLVLLCQKKLQVVCIIIVYIEKPMLIEIQIIYNYYTYNEIHSVPLHVAFFTN